MSIDRTDRPALDLYSQSLFPSHEAYREGCTARATIYCAWMAAAILCAPYKRWVMHQSPAPPSTSTFWPWAASPDPPGGSRALNPED